MRGKIPPIHPGEILKEEFLEPMGVTPNHLAVRLGVPSQRIYEILAGKRALSLDTALRLAAFFGTSWELWTGLQDQYEMQVAEDQGLLERIKTEVRPMEAQEKWLGSHS
jgi:addiction module HigA family antidote